MIKISKNIIIKIVLSLVAISLIVFTGIFIYNKYYNISVYRVRVSNISSNSATITWATDKPTKGFVILQTSNGSLKYSDIRGEEERYTHFVTLNNLDQDTQYSFNISNGISEFTYFDANQNVDWDDIATVSDFRFETKSTQDISITIPQVSYGKLDISTLGNESVQFSDMIVFSQAYKTDESGALIENTGSEIRASLVNTDGGWTVNRSEFQYGRKDLTIQYLDQRDIIYIVPEGKDRYEMAGTFALMGQQDNPLNTISIASIKQNINNTNSKINSPFITKVNAASGFCCQLSYQGREKDYMDYEEGDTCSSCDDCFKLGRINGDGQALVKIQQLSVDRKTCEAMKPDNSAGYTPPTDNSNSGNDTGTNNGNTDNGSTNNGSSGSSNSGSTSGTGICCVVKYQGRTNDYYDYENSGNCSQLFPVNSIKPQGRVLAVTQHSNVTREACESRTLQAGSTHTSSTLPTGSTIFPNKVCNTNLDDNKFKVAGIDKAQFVSYANRLAGTGNYAEQCFEYVACKAREDGLNPAFVLDIWMHESGASNYTKYPTVEDMGIHCYGGNSKFKPYPCNTTPKKDLKSQVEMFNALPHTKCLTSLTVDLARWAAGYWTGSSCDMAKGNQYVKDLELQWKSYGKGSDYTWIKDTSKAEKNLNCDGLTTNTPSTPSTNGSYFPENNPSTPSTTDESTSVVTTNIPNTTPQTQIPRVCCAVLTQNATEFFTDSERTLNCADRYKIGTGNNPADPIVYVTQIPYTTDAACDGKRYPIICENGFPKPQGQNIVGPSTGTHPKCIMADPNVIKDNILDIPITEGSESKILGLLNKVFAETDYIDNVENSIITFNTDGLYDIEIKGNKVSNLPVNKNMKYRLYINKNNKLGYQDNSDQLLAFSKFDVKVTRKSDVYSLNIDAGVNIISFNFNPQVNNRALKASELLNYINVEGVKVAYISYFKNGSWADGIRVDENNIGKYLGVDFNIEGSVGYIMVSQVSHKDETKLVLPGTKLNDNNTFNINKGWNQIVMGSKELKATQFITKMASNNVIISYWDTTKGMYVTYKKEQGKTYGEDFMMKKNGIYFIYTDTTKAISL